MQGIAGFNSKEFLRFSDFESSQSRGGFATFSPMLSDNLVSGNLLRAFFAFLVFSAPWLCADEIKIDPVLNGESQTGREWLDAKWVVRDLEAQLEKALPPNLAKDKKAVDTFLKDPKNRLLLARWYFVDAVGVDALVGQIEKLSDRRTFFQFLSSLTWLEGYLYTGRPENASAFLEILLEIAKKDKNMVKDPMLRKIATATAAEFSRHRWGAGDPRRAVKRYLFFSESWQDGKLNTLFDDLKYWDMRVVCGWKGDNDFGNEYSMRWARDNVKLPEEAYGNGYDIHQLDYRLWNKAGDSVHNSDYYAPFRPYFSTKRGEVNMSAMALEVGAVCGGISHYGASAAVSNGIPALTMGEPGHCAFAVRVNGVWRDNNSVSYKRDLHWTLLDGGRTWAFIHLIQDLFSDAKTAQSFRKAALARFYAGRKAGKDNRSAALSLYGQSLTAQPKNYLVWIDYCNYLKEQKAPEKFWHRANQKIIDAFTEKYPDVTATALQRYVYPNLFATLKTDEKKLKVYEAFMEKISVVGPASWDMESFWDFQVGQLSPGRKGPFIELGKKLFKGKGEFEKNFNDWSNGNSRNNKKD